MTDLFLDLETYSATPIQNGTHVYAADAEIMIMAYAIDDGPVKVWDCTETLLMPDDLAEALENEEVTIIAHNSHFDRTVMWHNGYQIPVKRWRDTMVQAYAHSMPGALGTLCEILGVPEDQAKMKRGRELVHLFCKPRPATSKIKRATRETHPAEWAEFKLYAGNDISSMRIIGKKLPKWNYSGAELDLWHLDQVINDRGFMVDMDLTRAAIRAVTRAQESLTQRTQEITNYDAELGTGLRAATQRDKLLAWLLEEHGVELPDMKASTLERRVNDETLPDMLRELLRIRLQASTSSTSKYRTLTKAVSDDHRLRGSLQFCGANRTGRYAGRQFQPQNLPRPNLKQHPIDNGIALMKADAEDLAFDNVMELTSNTIRGCIIAPEGKKLVIADLSNIEGRMLAWLAGEEWKLNAFRLYDTFVYEDGEIKLDSKGEPLRRGHDLYVLAYAKSFGVAPETVDKEQRQAGKVQELALGYQGGVGAFLTFALTYKLDLEKMAEEAIEAIPEDILKESQGFLKWRCKAADKKLAHNLANGMPVNEANEIHRQACQKIRFGLSEQAFIVCDAFKRSWRNAHPEITLWWRELEDTARLAIQTPGKVFPCRKVKMIRTGAWLRIVLPSGRALCYPSPKVGGICETCKGEGEILIEDIKQTCPDCDGERKSRASQISYMGINQYSRKWSRISTYGGKIAENITQAAARDVLLYAMPEIEKRGYEIVLSVHDELLTEAPDTDEYNVDELSALMATTHPWAKGLPLAAAGFEAYRYKKG